MELKDEEVGNYSNIDNIKADLMDARESARVDKIISNLNMYSENIEMLTNEYTDILNDDNSMYILTKISQNEIFMRHFPEFYVKNQYGEDVINCQQNSPYHRYGVFKHILYTIEFVGDPQVKVGDWHKMLLKWTMLLHDIGKPYVKIIREDGTDSFAGHDDKSVELAIGILDRFSFTKEEKNIILTLIKYHDKFLNEGEITYDNLKFLAGELEEKKELFYLLINVKDADARAKSIDVYNTYKLTRNKYLEFANNYFEHTDIANTINDNTVRVYNYDTSDIAIAGDGSANNSDESIVSNSNVALTDEEQSIKNRQLDNLIEEVLNKKKIGVLYQPIIDLETESVEGYETYSIIEDNKNINITEFLKYSKDSEKYDKIQQILFINAVESFEQVDTKEADKIFANIDIESYEKYVNKPRIYDMFQRNPLTMEIHNYEKFDLSTLQAKIQNIRQRGAKIALDHFGIGVMKIDDLKMLTLDYVKPDISLIRDIHKDEVKQRFLQELSTFCLSKEIDVVAVGIEQKEELDFIKSIGIRYVQGYYFSYPIYSIDIINDKISKIINNEADKKIN